MKPNSQVNILYISIIYLLLQVTVCFPPEGLFNYELFTLRELGLSLNPSGSIPSLVDICDYKSSVVFNYDIEGTLLDDKQCLESLKKPPKSYSTPGRVFDRWSKTGLITKVLFL